VTASLARPCLAGDERAARRDLREQIARLERRLAACPAAPPAERGAARLLGLDELERTRDALATNLAAAERAAREAAQGEAGARRRLEAMRADPRAHRGRAVALADLGLPGCGVYRPRPRLGVIGRLAGWWQVTLSSGCP
jgi:acyl-CoA reductase-like NAD-dependent aldehyde dehydrogenase